MQNMPEDFLLRNVNGQDVWVSEGETDSVEIKSQSHVRIKIANVQLQPEKLVRLCCPCDCSSIGDILGIFC
jgi:protein-arginine kinase